MGSEGPPANLVRELRRQLSIQDQLGGSLHRWGAFAALLVQRLAHRFVEAGQSLPYWIRSVIDRARAIADTNPDDSDFDSDGELTEYLNAHARPC